MEHTFPWPDGCRGAVSLSYDDGLPVHCDWVAPELEARGLRATFYLPVLALRQVPPERWKALAAAGHELGNHTIFHPCRQRPGGILEWLKAGYELQGYTPLRWEQEIAVANTVLSMIDGRAERTFGNTCCDSTIGPDEAPQRLEPLIERHFPAARGELVARSVDPWQPQWANLGHFSGDGRAFEDLRAEVEAAVAEGHWLIYMFHGIGPGTHHLHADAEQHRLLLDYLGATRERIWTAPVRDVVVHVRTISASREAAPSC
jgi:peptidoglycan/xylan/chitin deacetylase (PgdA/CDA1 family)